MQTEADYVLELEDIRKEYGDNVVLNGISFAVKPGDIYALLGENGAGKSTLMNILFGMSVIHETGGYSGKIKVSGEEVHFTSPIDALEAGIGMVHQEFMLIPGFTITENIKLGREDATPTALSLIFGKYLDRLDQEKMANDARKSLDSIGMGIDEHAKVAGLPVGYMQFVEIAREIDKLNIKLLVFDEPTAVLTESEAAQFLDVMCAIADKGIAVIFITHRLSEVMQVTNRITILRDGEMVATKPTSETSMTEIAELMVGRAIEKLEQKKTIRADVSSAAPSHPTASGHPSGSDSPAAPDHPAGSSHQDDVVVRVKNLYVDMPGESVKGATFDVRKGEIFGIGGLAGQGKVGIANGIGGLFPSEGRVEVFGEVVNLSKLGDALAKGVAFVSEDRRGVGLLLEESIAHNIIFRAMTTKKEYLRKFGFARLLHSRAMRKHAKEMIKLLDIRCRSRRQKVGTLSGGNQQKICLASALTMKPRLLIVSEPTRGIDIGAKDLILNYLTKLRDEEGLTIIIISSELAELRSICDRIAIVSDGKITDTLLPDAPDADYGLAMSAVVKSERVV